LYLTPIITNYQHTVADIEKYSEQHDVFWEWCTFKANPISSRQCLPENFRFCICPAQQIQAKKVNPGNNADCIELLVCSGVLVTRIISERLHLLNKYEPPLWLNLKPSGRLQRIIGVVRVLALTACLSNALPIVVKGLLFAMTCAGFTKLAKRLKQRQDTIRYSDATAWELSTGEGGFECVRILPSTVVTKYALFLHVESRQKSPVNKIALPGTNKKAVLIPADSLSDDEYRRLIVKLITTMIKQEQVFVSVDKIKPIEIKNTSI